MIVRILANLAIILVNFYVLIKLKGNLLPQRKQSILEILSYVLIQTIVGLFMVATAPVILGVRFDFRIILYIMMNKYLGPKITVPTIVLLSLSRLFFTSYLSLFYNLLMMVILIVTLPRLFRWSKRYFNELGQLMVVNDIYLLILCPMYVFSMGDIRQGLLVTSVILLASTAFIIVIHYVSKDIEKMFELAVIDNLSSLFNSRQLHLDMANLSEHTSGYALLIIDIDDFKKYNDQFGHLLGDEVIRRFSSALRQAVDNQGQAYRYGGEEFVVIIQDPQGKIAYKVAQAVRDAVRALAIPCDTSGRQAIHVTASIGIAYQWKAESLLDTFGRADNALYTAKITGKDRIIIG